MRAVPGSPWPWRGWEFQWEVPVGAPGLASHGPSGSWWKGPGGLCNKQRLVIGHQLRAGRKGTLGKATLWHWSYWKAVSLHLREHWRARLSLQRSRSAPILPEMLISSRGIQTSVIGHHAPSGQRLLRAARGRCNTDVPRGRGSLPRRALRGRAEAEAEEVVAPRGARRGSPAHRHPQVSGAALGRFAAAWRWGVAARGVQRRGAAPDRWGAAGPAPPLPVPPPALGALSGPSWGGRWGGRPCWAGPGRASSFGLCSASALRLKGPQRCAVTVLVALQEACAARELWLSGRNVICVLEKLFVVSACKNCAGVPLNLLQVKAKLQVQWENKYINALFFGSLCLKHKCSKNCIRSNKALLIIYYRLVKEEKGSTITFPGSKRSSASVCCCASAKEKTSCNAFILRAHIERAWSHFYIRMAFNSHGESECGGSVTSHVFVAAERCPAHSCVLFIAPCARPWHSWLWEVIRLELSQVNAWLDFFSWTWLQLEQDQ